ncbi:MAG: type II toxin-antitoxin system RelB/DinJ family antitoxin [Deltaproteobacteria bacterium]|nr:type II toxin-antitoxin system RelB/DinJ family antitoxin [Deltaproteobacteria bacterium]MBW1965710.1 type II toxin-antitoxin system RelB/DinJ family antitoxin [Deltaproteobacteria bacterium]
MAKNTSVNVRTTEEIKKGAEVILSGLGLNMSSAVNLFLKQVINYRGIPFDLRLPNKETLHAMDDIENSRNLESADTVGKMFKKIGV